MKSGKAHLRHSLLLIASLIPLLVMPQVPSMPIDDTKVPTINETEFVASPIRGSHNSYYGGHYGPFGPFGPFGMSAYAAAGSQSRRPAIRSKEMKELEREHRDILRIIRCMQAEELAKDASGEIEGEFGVRSRFL